MNFENPFFDKQNASMQESDSLGFHNETAGDAEREFGYNSEVKLEIYWHDLLWKKVADKTVDNILDIPQEELPELLAAAEYFSKPDRLKEFKNKLNPLECSRADKLIHELLNYGNRVGRAEVV